MAKYNELTQGQIEATVNKLGGMEGVQRFLSGKSTVKSVSPFDFKVWKTIGLGTGLVAASNFESALRSKGQVAYDLSKKVSERSILCSSLPRSLVSRIVRPEETFTNEHRS